MINTLDDLHMAYPTSKSTSSKPPETYKKVQSSIIANWVKLVLKIAGMDASLYKAHSCRSTSTSKVKALGMSLRSKVRDIDLAKAL